MDDITKVLVSFSVMVVLFLFVIVAMIYYMSFDKFDEQEYLVVKRFDDRDKSASILSRLDRNANIIMSKDIMYPKGSLGYEALTQLRLNYGVLEENDRIWKIGHKAETRKMKDISLTLRNKEGKFLNKDVVDFVFYHELAHVATPKSVVKKNDHADAYWIVFGMILDIAKREGLYKPVDYISHPMEYCGTKIIYNPWYSDWKDNITKSVASFEQ